MGGRSFGQYNKVPPACVDKLASTVPACFDQKGWRLYLLDCWFGRLNDAASRERMRRGAAPDFCSSCTRSYQAKMLAAGRCHPPAKTKGPSDD